MRAFRRLVEAIEAEGSAALVTLARVEGSSPREAGTRMVVRPSGGFHGTVGGGALEFAALEAANEALEEAAGQRGVVRSRLGLSLASAAVAASNGESRRSICAISTIFRHWLSPKAAPQRRSARGWGLTDAFSAR